jgi:hypothetical protein
MEGAIECITLNAKEKQDVAMFATVLTRIPAMSQARPHSSQPRQHVPSWLQRLAPGPNNVSNVSGNRREVQQGKKHAEKDEI